MSLLNYDEVRPWAREIQEKVVKKIMPPYYAGGQIGRFVGDPRLTDEEIHKICSWVDNGAPKGDPRSLPPPKEWICSAWQGGTPDLVLKMPHPFAIKPDMQDGYAFFVLDYVFDQDTWIRGVEVSPGNRTAVHHANVYMVPSSIKTLADGRIDNVFDPVALGGSFVTAWEPGSAPLIHPDGVGTLVKKGTRFAILMHYSPSDKELSDQTSIGFYLADGCIHKQARILYGGTRKIDLPARTSNYEIVETREFMTDAMIRAFTCHMHLRGKSFAVRFHYPDGKVETAFEVPHYDVNWQQLYVLVAPIFVPRKTIAEYIAIWDNSSNNPVNPDPAKNVKWGDRATDEMMDGYLNYISVHEDLNIPVKSGHVVAHVSEKRAAPAPASVASAASEPSPVKSPPAPAGQALSSPQPASSPQPISSSASPPARIPANEVGGGVSASQATDRRPKVNADAETPGMKRYLVVGSTGILVLLSAAIGYLFGRRKRSVAIARRGSEAWSGAAPAESGTPEPFQITTGHQAMPSYRGAREASR